MMMMLLGGSSGIRRRLLLSVALGFCLGIALGLVVASLFDGDDDCFVVGDEGRTRQLRRIPIGRASNDHGHPHLVPLPQQPLHLRKPHKIVRPRYYSSELGIKQKLFVGIISNYSTIGSLGAAINKTIGLYVDQLVFFVDSINSLPKLETVKVVGFENNVPPLQPFHVLRHIGDNFAMDYDYFFLTIDTTYVHGLSLRELVDHISISSLVYMGSKLDDGVYCSLAAGVLLSHSVLQLMLQNLNWCTTNAFSENMESNIGRCVHHSANITCSNRVQGQTFYSHMLEEDLKSQDHVEKLMELAVFNNSVTVSQLPSAEAIYRLHHIFTEIELRRAKALIRKIRQNMLTIMEKEPSKHDHSWPLGHSAAVDVEERFDLLHWNYFTMKDLYMSSDFNNVKDLAELDLQDIMDVMNESICNVRVKYPARQFQFLHLMNGYRRFDPVRGLEYLLDLAFRDKHSGLEIHKRFQVVRPLSKVEIVPIPYVTENTRVTLLLFVDINNNGHTIQFLKNYAKVCLNNQDNTALVLVFIYNLQNSAGEEKDDIYKKVKIVANTYSSRYPDKSTKMFSVTIKSGSSQTSEIGILDLIVKRFPIDTLFLICNAAMEHKTEYLNRVRMNTIRNWQIFSPVPFIRYHPGIVYKDKPIPSNVEFNKHYGHFDDHNYDYLSFYASDYLEGRKTVQHEIPLAKSEKDIGNNYYQSSLFGIYQMFLKMQNMHVLRTPEPGLTVNYIFHKCQHTLDNTSYRECSRSRMEGLASRMQLADLVLQQHQQENI